MSERFDTFGRPTAGHGDGLDWNATEAEPGDEGGELGPHEAAALLERTTRQAERAFEIRPPLLILAAALTVLVAYGAVWLSVRHQHPYSGPTGTALAVLYGTLAAWGVLVATVLRRGLRGRSSRQRRLEGLVFVAIWVCVYVFQAALHHVNSDPAIAYGVYPAVAPLIVVGSAAATYQAAREKWGEAGFAAAAVVFGAFAAFTGPASVWAVVGVGFCVLLLVGAAGQLWRRGA